MQVAQGDLAGALTILPRRPRHRRAPGEVRPRQCGLAARSVGVAQQGRRRAGGARRPDGRADNPTATSLAIERAPGQGRPRQCGLAARSVGVVRQGRRRAGGAGRSGGRAEILPRQPRHQRAPGEGRPRQCGLAARSVGVVREGRRRAGGAGRSGGRADNPTATASPSQSAWPSPTPATRAGSAICRCRTTRSATCRWRRAIWRAR